jgi:hypothetical protein
MTMSATKEQKTESIFHRHLCITCERPVDCRCDDEANGGNEHVWCREGMTFNEYNRAFSREF